MAGKYIGRNYIPPDHVAKVTGRARYAEDFRAEGMLFTKLLLSPMPHARVRSVDTSAALARRDPGHQAPAPPMRCRPTGRSARRGEDYPVHS